MHIVYTKHLRLRLRIRSIPFQLPRFIVTCPDELFFDTFTQVYVAVKRFRVVRGQQEYMVAFIKRNGSYLLITIHPLRSEQKAHRIVSKRWRRIKTI